MKSVLPPPPHKFMAHTEINLPFILGKYCASICLQILTSQFHWYRNSNVELADH